jgi:hypothetical protein
MLSFFDSLSQSLSALLRPRVTAAALPGFSLQRPFRRLLAIVPVVVPWIVLAAMGAASVAWALAMLALVR